MILSKGAKRDRKLDGITRAKRRDYKRKRQEQERAAKAAANSKPPLRR
jgi:hypothetical protein